MNGKLTTLVRDGYFKACAKFPGKLIVEKDDQSVTYSIGTELENFPFQFGEGVYKLRYLRSTGRHKYIWTDSAILISLLTNPLLPFLKSNQYVKTDLPFLDTINTPSVSDVKAFIERWCVYDYIKALTTKSNALPDIERCYTTHMGICQDIAALTVALLRKIKVPARLVIGKANSRTHAWTEIYYADDWKIYDPTAKIKHVKKQINYVKERWY